VTTVAHVSSPPFGSLMRQWRQRRRLSQLDLAIEADVSARHVSFIETGRSAPSRDMVLRLAKEHEVLITVEEGAIGGFGAFVMQTLAENGALDRGLKVRCMMLPDRFIDQDSPAAMYAQAGLDAKGIVAKVFEALGKDVRIDVVQHA